MANRRVNIQIDLNGPSPLIINANGTFDKRTTLTNLSRLLRGIDKGSTTVPVRSATTVVVQQTLVQASATATPAAVAGADTLSIGGTALTATQRRASATVTAATAIVGNTVTINGVVFTGVAGAAVLGTATFSIDTGNTQCATSIAAQVNAYAPFAGTIGAKSAAAVVTLYAVQQGTGGNAYTLASSGATLAVSGAVLSGGTAPGANNTFDFAGSDALTGAAIAAAINASTTAAVKTVTATAAASGVVTITSKQPGLAGNTTTFVSSNGTRLAVTGAGFLASGAMGAPTAWTF